MIVFAVILRTTRIGDESLQPIDAPITGERGAELSLPPPFFPAAGAIEWQSTQLVDSLPLASAPVSKIARPFSTSAFCSGVWAERPDCVANSSTSASRLCLLAGSLKRPLFVSDQSAISPLSSKSSGTFLSTALRSGAK